MKEIKYYCDKCKAEVDYANLFAIAIGTSVGPFHGFTSKIKFELCPQCAEKIGLIKKMKDDEIETKSQDLKGRLYDVFADLVAEIGGQAEY